MSPVHLRARRTAQGVRFTWIRRTQIDGDGWALDEVPLGEDIERYELDVLDANGFPLRTLQSDAPSALYSTEFEIADFGSPQSAIRIAIAQLSAIVGRGFVRRATLLIP